MCVNSHTGKNNFTFDRTTDFTTTLFLSKPMGGDDMWHNHTGMYVANRILSHLIKSDDTIKVKYFYTRKKNIYVH
jgi:hypothetical protein